MDENNYTLPQKLEELSHKTPEKIILQIKTDEEYISYSYQEIFHFSQLIAQALIRQAIKKGDRIALVLENRPEWPMIYFGILLAGAIAVPLDPQSNTEDMRYFLDNSKSKFIFTSTKFFSSIKNACATLKEQHNIILVEEELIGKQSIDPDKYKSSIKANKKITVNLLSEILAIENFTNPLPKISNDDTASILYTSGTTGKPKGVMLTHHNFYSNFESIKTLQLFPKNTNVISILPLHHTFPFMASLIVPLFAHCKITYLSSLSSTEILTCMRETNITILVGVPQLYYIFQKHMLEKIKAIPFIFRLFLRTYIELLWLIRKYSKINLSKICLPMFHRPFGKTLKYFVCGGAKFSPDAALFLTKLGFTLVEGYGLTETSPVVTFNPTTKTKIGSVGQVIPNVHVKIANPDENNQGEIAISGPNVMKGYYLNEAATQESIKEGWFYSGDLGYLDKDNYLYITGRKKDLIILSSGKNISPEEIESHYIKSKFIKELCVLAVGEKIEEEKLMAIIVPDFDYFRKIGDVNIQGMIKWDLENLSKQYSPYKRIMGFVISTQALPKTRLGKLKRFLIKDQYINNLKGQKEPKTIEITDTPEDLKTLSSDTWKSIEPIIMNESSLDHPLQLDDHLEIDLGFDSLTRVELMVAIEKALSIPLSEEQMAKIFTVRELVTQIDEHLSHKRPSLRSAKLNLTEASFWHDLLHTDPPKNIIKQIDLNPGWFAKTCAIIFCQTWYGIFKLFWRLKVYGIEHLPKNSAFILCSNHVSYFDPFIIAASGPNWLMKTIFSMSYRVFFELPIIRLLTKVSRVIPIDPGARLIDALQASAYILNNNRVVSIFPAGARSINGEVQPFKKGVGILSKELDVPLVPVYIKGAFEAWPRGRSYPTLHPIEIYFGTPIDSKTLLKNGRHLGAKNDYEAISFAIRNEVIRLQDRHKHS